MAHLIPNSFSSWELTDAERMQGSILTATQKQVIETHRAGIAMEKLSLTFDPMNPLIFTQQEASLAGQLQILDYLLDLSETSVDLAKQVYQQEQ